MVLGYDGPEAMADYHQMFMDERAACGDATLVSPGVVNEEFVALCPTVLADDGDEGLKIGARAQRFFAEAIQYWAAPNLQPPAHNTDKVDNVAYLKAKAAEVEAAGIEATKRGEDARPRLPVLLRRASGASSTPSATPTRPSTTSAGSRPGASPSACA